MREGRWTRGEELRVRGEREREGGRGGGGFFFLEVDFCRVHVYPNFFV